MGSGVNICVITGLTRLLKDEIPLSMAGDGSVMMPGLMVCELGIRLNTVSMENGRISLRPTNAQKTGRILLYEVLLKKNLRRSTAGTSQLAAMLMLRTFMNKSDAVFRNKSAIGILPSVAINHLLYLVDFLIRNPLMPDKGSDKCRQRALKFFLHQFINFGCLYGILGHQ